MAQVVFLAFGLGIGVTQFRHLNGSGPLTEAMLAVLSPTTRSLDPVFLEQLRGAVMGAPLPFGESLMIAWPQTMALTASTIVLFVAGYVVFQRQEVRA